jgi:hypothetical protein
MTMADDIFSPPPRMPLLLTAAQARCRLGVSERGLRALLKRGLPYVIVGKRKMYPASDLSEWISEQARQCTTFTNAKGRHTGTYRTPRTEIAFDIALARTTPM